MNLLSTEILYQIHQGKLGPDRKLTEIYEVSPRVYYQTLTKGIEEGWYQKDPKRGLAFVKALKKTAVPDYAHINLIAGVLYEADKKYDEAESAYIREALIYPALLTPLLNLYRLYYMLNQNEKMQVVDGMIKQLMVKRCILPEMIPYILSDISLDMRPWNIQNIMENKQMK